MNLELRCPTLKDEPAFWLAHNASKTTAPNFFHFYVSGMAFLEWINVLEDKRNGRNLETGLGPSTFFLAWLGEIIVGRLTFRHSMDENILNVRGHMGYVVLPEFRNQGFATQILQLALPFAKNVGLRRILLTCDKGNIASLRTIEKCGGVFFRTHTPSDDTHPKLQFWINLE